MNTKTVVKKTIVKDKKPVKRKPAKKKVKQVSAVPEVKKAEIPQFQRKIMSEVEIIEAFDLMGITAKLNDKQKKLFIAIAREFQLNPLRREIHAVKMGGDDEDGSGGILVPVVGYEVYIDRAEETERLEYWHLEDAGEIDTSDWRKSTYRVTLVVKRRDWAKEFRWTVYYTEAIGLKYDKSKRILEPNSMWRKRGYFMTKKCCIGQGFRLVFREILRGMPYIDAEIENAEIGENHQEEKGELRPPQALPTVSLSGGSLPGIQPDTTVIITPEPTIQIVEDIPAIPKTSVYAEIMQHINAKEQSKEGPMISLFASAERVYWKAKADKARANQEELISVLQELDVISDERKTKIREGI